MIKITIVRVVFHCKFNLDTEALEHYSITYAPGNTPKLINQKLVKLRRKQDAHTHTHACRTLNNYARRYKLALLASCQKTAFPCEYIFVLQDAHPSNPLNCNTVSPISACLRNWAIFRVPREKGRIFLPTHSSLFARTRAREANCKLARRKPENRRIHSNKAALIRARQVVCMLSVRRYMHEAQIPRPGVCVYGFCIFEREQICAKQRDSRVS